MRWFPGARRGLPRAMVALALLASVSACQPSTPHGQRTVYCSITADPPTRDDRDHPKRVVSQVRYWCENPGPSRLSLTLRLQKQGHGGVWVDVARTSVRSSGAATLRTDTARYRSRTVTAGCADGEYRTVVDGDYRSGTVTRTYHGTGHTTNPCRTLL